MSLVLADEVCAARSCCSISTTRRSRPAASRAMPAPLMPPPTTARSKPVSVVATNPAAQLLRPAGPCLDLEPPLFRCACGPGCLARHRRAPCLIEQCGEALQRVAAVGLLCAMAARDDHDLVSIGETATGQCPQAVLGGRVELPEGAHVKAQLRR